jgi:hypothetical protein
MNEQLEKLFGPNFKLKEINSSQTTSLMGILAGNILESNRVFTYLKSELELYYKEKNRPLKFQSLFPHKSLIWKDTFYSTLHSLLNEIVYTLDAAIKDSLINKVYKWYVEKSQRQLTVVQPLSPQKIRDTTKYPLILQQIESTSAPELPIYLPKLPNTSKMLKPSESLKSTDSLSDIFSKPQTAGSISCSPVRKRRSKYLLKLVQKSKDRPVFLDFRASSVGNETMRTTNFTDRDFAQKSLIGRDVEGRACSQPKVAFQTRDQMAEVMMVKRRLASQQMTLPVRVLESGLVFADFSSDLVPPHQLPRGGELLLHDPSAKKDGKKKRKKGKKG